MKQGLAMAYNIKRRNAKMAHGGMAHCAHGGPAYCNQGCYADGGEVEEMHPEHDEMSLEPAAKSMMQAKNYEESMEEPMNEAANKPRDESMNDENSMKSRAQGKEYFEEEEEPMKMAHGGMMHPRHMVKAIMKMASGGRVNSSEAWKKADAMKDSNEDHGRGMSDKEDIDVYQTTPHDDFLSSEEDYPLDEEEGYEEGMNQKGRRKAKLLDRVMEMTHSR